MTEKNSSELLRQEIDRALRRRKGRAYFNLGDVVVQHICQVAFEELKGHLPKCAEWSDVAKRECFFEVADKLMTHRRIDRAIRDVGQAHSVTVIMRPNVQT